MQTLSSKYNLFSTERVYRHETLLSYYFQSNKKVVKKFKPVDLDGERYRLNLETGELGCYKLSDIYNSKAASVRRSVIHMNMLLEMNDFFGFGLLLLIMSVLIELMMKLFCVVIQSISII